MSTVTSKFIEKAIATENKDYSKVLGDVANGFKASGFFLNPDWNKILTTNFKDNDVVECSESEMEIYVSVGKNNNNKYENQPTNEDGLETSHLLVASKSNIGVSKQSREENEIVIQETLMTKSHSSSSPASFPLSLLKTNSSTPVHYAKITSSNSSKEFYPKRIDTASVHAKYVKTSTILENLQGTNWTEICSKVNEEQSKVPYVSTFDNCKCQIDKMDSINIVAAKQLESKTAKQSSSDSKTIANSDPKHKETDFISELMESPASVINNDLSDADSNLDETQLCVKSTSSVQIPKNADDTHAASASQLEPTKRNRKRIITYPLDYDSNDEDLLIPMKVRTPSPIVSVSRTSKINSFDTDIKIKVENNIENDIDHANDSEMLKKRTNEFMQKLTGADWMQISSEVNKQQSKVKYISDFDAFKDSQVVTRIHSQIVVDQKELSSKKKYSSKKQKLDKHDEQNSKKQKLDKHNEQNQKPSEDSTAMPKVVLGRCMTRLQTRLQTQLQTQLQTKLVASVMLQVSPLSSSSSAADAAFMSVDMRSNIRMETNQPILRVKFAIDPEPYALLLKQLNIIIVPTDANTDYDVLVTDRIGRSKNFMCTLGSGKSIASIEWINAMRKSQSRLEPNEFLLYDEDGERKYKFSLKKTLQAAAKQRIFRKCSILVTPHTYPLPDVLKEVIISCGGKYLKTSLVPRKGDRILCVSDVQDKRMWPRLTTKYENLKDIITVSGFLQAIFQYNLDVSDYRMCNSHQ